MRLILLFLLLLLGACRPSPDPTTYGTRTVTTRECRDPQTGYHAEGVLLLNALGLAEWQAAMPPADVTVACDDFVSECLDFGVQEACGAHAGYYNLGESVVHVDHGRANGYFAFTAVENHELVHLYIAQGPHPERARMHVCPCGVSDPECWPGGCGALALMAPTQAGLGTGTGSSWSGDTERVDVGTLTQNEPTWLDMQFVRWAVTP
jgi:hypothetical protein